MRLYVTPVLACLVFHASVIWAVPSFSGQIAPELRGKRSFVKSDRVNRTIFEHEATGSKVDFVTNSGICETTPGVNQYSGYFSVGTNISYFFWFFEARHSPKHAPLAAWFNGGPGCSSMIGLFQENGPCQFYNGSSTPSLNPYSWNNYANMLYIDQPAGVGFSYESGQTNSSVTCENAGLCNSTGVNNPTVEVNTTVAAAPFVWKLVQAFFAQFPEYENRDFGIFTESYGGHYGPEFAYYFEEQNKAIEAGTVVGQHVDLVALGINNGWYDAKIQEREEIEFYYKNTYYPLINESTYDSLVTGYNELCLPAFNNCTSAAGDDQDFPCMEANIQCARGVDGPASSAFDPSIDSYDIRQRGNNTTPPETYATYLSDPAIMKAIGARGTYSECSDDVGNQFDPTGDSARSLLPELSEVVKSGITTLMWAGDADAVCDWFGGLASAEAVDYSESEKFKNKAVRNYTVNGVVGGTYKTVGNLSWLRVFGSGHFVAYFQPELALQAFKQTMKRRPIHGT